MSNEAQLGRRIVSGVLWNGTGRAAMKCLRFVIAVVLARLLLPEQFGIIAIASFFLMLCEMFIDCGFSAALIQRKELTDDECSSVFWFNMLCAGVLYALLFFCAPSIAGFYRCEILSPVLRVIGLILIISSLTIIPRSLLCKRLDFKRNAIIRWVALLGGGTVAIVMALRGFGIWALVAEYLTGEFLKLILYPCFSRWRLSFHYRFDEVRGFFSFGYKLLLSDLMIVIQKNLSNMVLGKVTTMSKMSFFSRGYAYPQLLSDTLDGMFHEVIFSAMSSVQTDQDQLKKIRNSTLRISTYISFPALTLLAVSASELIPLMLTEKWSPCIVYLRIACIDIAALSVWGILQQQFNAVGRTDLTCLLRLLFLFSAVLIFSIVIVRQMCGRGETPLWAISTALTAGDMLCLIPLFLVSKRCLNFSFGSDFLKNIGPNLIVSLVCGGAAWLAGNLLPCPHQAVVFAVKIVLFGTLYLLATYLFHMAGYDLFTRFIAGKMARR